MKCYRLGEEPVDRVFNRVWDITRASWPAPVPERMDKTRVVVRRLHDRDEDS